MNNDAWLLEIFNDIDNAPVVPVVEIKPAPQAELKPQRKCCPKCGGLGTLTGYRHIQNGTCFKCDGLGYIR